MKALKTHKAKRKLVRHLNLTGFKCSWRTSSCVLHDTIYSTYSKEGVYVHLTSWGNALQLILGIGISTIEISGYRTPLKSQTANEDSLTKALEIVKSAFPRDRPDRWRYWLKPILIGLAAMLATWIIALLLIFTWCHFLDGIIIPHIGEARFLIFLPPIAIIIGGVNSIVRGTTNGLLRIILITLLVGGVSILTWVFLVPICAPR